MFLRRVGFIPFPSKIIGDRHLICKHLRQQKKGSIVIDCQCGRRLYLPPVVTLKVYNVLGQEVATLVNEEREAGTHRVQFDGTGMASGVYLYRLQARLSPLSVGWQAGDYFETKKFVLLK